MENTVNRKEYRRSDRRTSMPNIEKIKRSDSDLRASPFIGKIMSMMLIFLCVLLLKYFGFEDAFDNIGECINSGITYQELKQYFIFQYQKWQKEENDLLEQNEKIEPDELISPVLQETSEIKQEEKTQELTQKVEGINQLLEDAEYIKKNYTLKAPLEGIITSEFGNRVSDNPIVSSYHTGLDIATSQGTPIHAAHSGKVIQAGSNGSYGNSIMIESGDLITLYAHCLSIDKKVGEYVEIGQNIAKVGMTGNATGPHLHFEVRLQERLVDPKDVMEMK